MFSWQKNDCIKGEYYTEYYAIKLARAEQSQHRDIIINYVVCHVIIMCCVYVYVLILSIIIVIFLGNSQIFMRIIRE